MNRGQREANDQKSALLAENDRMFRERLKKLHADGLSDVIIAKRLNCGTPKVARIRKDLGLPANKTGSW